MAKKLTQEEFVERAKAVHGDRYDYSKVEYSGNRCEIIIICKEHGEFPQNAGNHVKGSGCPSCNNARKSSAFKKPLSQFLDECFEAHGDRYDYSLVEYIRGDLPVKIICKEHGSFEQIPDNHIRGGNCPTCAQISRAESMCLTTDEFITKAVVVHGNRFDYSNTVYANALTKVIIGCKEHGNFSIFPHDHLKGCIGCKDCSTASHKEKMTFTTDEFINISNSVHGGIYDYSKSVYTGAPYKVDIICKEHGIFPQEASSHMRGTGCPSCACVGPSKSELELFEFVKSICLDAISSDRKLIPPKELDIVIPSKNIAIEFNGVYYHSDIFSDNMYRHKEKTDSCREIGYNLLHIYEDDWRFKRDIVEQKLKHILGIRTDKVHARKLDVKLVDAAKAKAFLDKTHIQGHSNGEAICLVDGDEIVAAMQFSISKSERGNSNSTRYELVRYATSKVVVGGASKLFKYFTTNNPSVQTIISYSDNDTTTGKMYDVLGFEFVHTTKPDYKYVVRNKREHKSKFRRSEIAKKYPEVYSENLSESEMCKLLGFPKIYNSGLTKWEWKRP